MEEYVGELWHRLITRAAATTYPDAAVQLEDMAKTVGIMFRALGGDRGLRIEAVSASRYETRRNWLQRVAGSHEYIELAWFDDEALRLPSELAVFPEKSLNRDLYLWLAALAASDADHSLPWFHYNQQLTANTLKKYTGLKTRYQRLLTAQLALRPSCSELPEDEAAQEQAIQAALQYPTEVEILPYAKKAHHPVSLWLHPFPPNYSQAIKQSYTETEEEEEEEGKHTESKKVKNERRRQGRRTPKPDGNTGLLAFRLESLFTRSEYTKVDRTSEDEEDEEQAENALEDMDEVSVMQDQRTTATNLRFDLDLPASEFDDIPLGEGIHLPEWDYKKQLLQKKHCCLQEMLPNPHHLENTELPTHLSKTAKKLRRQFEALSPTRQWFRGQQEGSDIDLDAYLTHLVDKKRGVAQAGEGLYRDFHGGGRDLSCLLLADFSLSTDAWVNNSARVIDVIRDSLFLFSEALSGTRDKFAIYGFSSRHRQHVRFYQVKAFNQKYNKEVKAHINAIRPSYYTRMGAAIRQATKILDKQHSNQKLLLLLTDGKPNDLDQYEGRYGIEDTRMALHEARKQGLQPFCVTIDEKAGDYLPHLFGTNNYIVIRNPVELPKQLPLLYARLTQNN